MYKCVLQAPEYEAMKPTTVWYKTADVNYPVRVSVSESHIESLFCLKMEGTDGRALKKSNTKVCACVCVFVCVQTYPTLYTYPHH